MASKAIATSGVHRRYRGCGAIGASRRFNCLRLAGVGRLRVIDRDFVEPQDLQRQALFETTKRFRELCKGLRLRTQTAAVETQR